MLSIIPMPMLVFMGVVAVVWMVTLVPLVRRLDMSRFVGFAAWSMTLLSCASAVAYRLKIEAASSVLFAGGTTFMAVLFIAVILGAQRPKGDRRTWLVFAGCGYAVIEVLSLFVNGPFVPSLSMQTLSLVMLPGMLVLIYSSRATKQYLLGLTLRISNFVVYGSVLVGLFAPAIAYGNDYGDVRRYPIFGLEWRLAGLTPHQNLLSITAVIGLIVAFSIRARFRWLTALMSVLAIGMAESRNATMTVAIVLVVAWLLKGKSITVRLLPIIPVVVLTYNELAELLTADTAASGLTADVGTFNTRTVIWDSVIRHFADRPLLGWGPLAFQKEAMESPFPVLQFLNAHNQLLEGLAEGGILGLAFIGAFIAALVVIAVRHLREPLYPAIVITLLISMATEVFFTVHLYGLSYAAVPAFLSLMVIMSADAPSEAAPSEAGPAAAAQKSSLAQQRTPVGGLVRTGGTSP